MQQFYKFKNPQKVFLSFIFNFKLSCLVSHLSFSRTKLFLSFIFSFLEEFLLSFLLFASCFSTFCHCFISPSIDIDSAHSVSVSCNTPLAINTFNTSALLPFAYKSRGSKLASLFLQKLLWRHNVTFSPGLPSTFLLFLSRHNQSSSKLSSLR